MFLRDQLPMSVSQTQTLLRHRKFLQKGSLSKLNGIYDPLRLIGALVIKGKILMHQLWTNCDK